MRWAFMVCLFCLAQAASTEVFRWTDEHGRVHYGERPPRSGAARRIDLPPAKTPSAVPDEGMVQRRARQERLLDSYAYERERKAAAAARDAEAEASRAAHCESLRRRWRRLSWAGPLYVRGAGGDRDYLSDEQRLAAKQRMRPAYQKACDAPPPD